MNGSHDPHQFRHADVVVCVYLTSNAGAQSNCTTLYAEVCSLW